MYILNVSYATQPANVEPHIPTHGAWIKQQMEAGIILAAGPKRSGLGGVLLVRSIPRAELDRILAEDSYVKAGVADYQVIELDWKLATEALAALKAH